MSDETFTTTFTVLSEVSDGIDSVKDVRTELIYSRVGQIPPKGIFYGDEEISPKLGRILLSGKAHFFGVWSSRSASFDIAFRVKHINFDRYEGRYESDKLCEFICDELEVETNYHLDKNGSDKVELILVMYAIPKRRELLLPKLPQELKKDLPEYKDWLQYETTLGSMKIERRTYSRAITVESKQGLFSFDESALSFVVPVGNRNLDEIIRQSERIVEDYVKLISFMLQCETEYYKQEVRLLNSEKQELKNSLRLIQRIERTPNERPILFEWQTVDKLLKELMPKFSSHSNKPDIEEAILLFLSGIHSKLAEACLILMEFAIETIMNKVKKSGHLKQRILQVVSKWDVEIKDIYPTVFADNKKQFPFIYYRNKLAHGERNKIDYNDLPSELYRQQLLLERLIFHWIGFDARKVKYLKLWEGVKPY